MEMVNGLSAVVPCIHHHPIALLQLLRSGKVCCSCHQVAEQRLVLSECLSLRRDVSLGNDKQVSGSLRIDVGECDAQLVFVDSISWYLTSDDLAEQAV